MKKFLISLLGFYLLASFALMINISVSYAAEAIDPLTEIESIGGETGLPEFQFGQHPDAPILEGAGTALSPVYFVIDLFRYVMSGIALIVVIVYAIKMVSVSEEEDAKKIKTGLAFGILGLLVIQLADIIVKKMFFGEEGEAFENAAMSESFATDANSEIRGIIGFVELFLGAVAVLVIIVRGFTLIMNSGDEEALKKAQTHIIYAFVGLAAVGLSEVVIRGFVFPEAGQKLPDVDEGKRLIVMITNYLSSFVAIIAFIMLFYAGYRYVVAGSEEETSEKVKKIFIGSVIALVLALGAFAAVNTLVKFKEPVDTSEVNEGNLELSEPN